MADPSGGPGWNDPSGIPGMTVGQLFGATYNQPGQDPYSIWQQQSGQNQPRPPTPSAPAPSGGGGGQNPGFSGSVADIFNRTYGPGGPQYNPSVSPYQAWLQQSVQNGTLSPQQAGMSATGGGLVSGQQTGGRFQTWDGTYKTIAEMQQLLQGAGSSQNLMGMDPNQALATYNSIAQNASQQGQLNIQNQNADAAARAKNATDLFTAIGSQGFGGALMGPLGQTLLPDVNAALQSLGLPALNLSAGTLGSQGVMPNGISPADWDRLPDAAKQLILLAWQSRGGNPNDFLAGIDAQRPQGGQTVKATAQGPIVNQKTPSPTVRFAPLAA